MGFLQELLSGHEAYFEAFHAECAADSTLDDNIIDINEEDSQAD